MVDNAEGQRRQAGRRLLAGIASGTDANDLASEIADLHHNGKMFPGEVFIEFGAAALALAGFNRDARVDHDDLLLKYLPEAVFRGKQNRRIQYTLFATFAVNGGLEPDLLEEASFWIDDFWYYSFLAAVAVIRACADQSDVARSAFAQQLAEAHEIDLA